MAVVAEVHFHCRNRVQSTAPLINERTLLDSKTRVSVRHHIASLRDRHLSIPPRFCLQKISVWRVLVGRREPVGSQSSRKHAATRIAQPIDCRGFQVTGGESVGAMLSVNLTLTSLNLGWNSLRKASAVAVANALQDNHTLLSLNLAYNAFSDFASQVIVYLSLLSFAMLLYSV